MNNDQPDRTAEVHDAEVLRLYRDQGAIYGDNPSGLARWLSERLGRLNNDRRNPNRNPKTDPRIQRGG